MKESSSDPVSVCSRRSFLKTAIMTLFGALAACVSRLSDERPVPPTQPSTNQVQTNTAQFTTGSTVSPVPPTATNVPNETPASTATTIPTTCPPDVECDQSWLSETNLSPDRSYSMPRRILNPNPTYIITSLCLRDAGCVEVCPVECIVPGFPQEEWPRYYIDPDTCIDCGACVPECPYEAIFPEDEVPNQYIARGGEYINRLDICGHYEGSNHHGEPIVLDTVCRLAEGQAVDLTVDIQDNYKFYSIGPGYDAVSDELRQG